MIPTVRWSKILCVMIAAALLVGSMVICAPAGQVVTAQLKDWAQQAVAQEKALQMVTKPRTITVLYFTNPAQAPSLVPLQKGLALMLTSDLAQTGVLTVIERAQLQALVEEMGFGQSGLVDPASAPRVGRLLQTEYLIGGQIQQDRNGQLELSATLLEVGPVRIIAQAKAQGQMEQIFELEKQLLDTILTSLNLNLSPQQKNRMSQPLAAQPSAALDFFQGIDASDKGDYEAADRFYVSALQTDPQFSMARQSHSELTQLKLVKVAAAPLSGAQQRQQLLQSVRNKTSMTTGLKPSLPDSRIPAPIGQEY